MPEASRSILITGARGFIGSALVEALLAAGRSVLALDVREPAPSPPGPSERASPRLVERTGEVTDAALVEELVAGAGLVVHLAAVVGVDEYLRAPERVLDVNILGSRNVLRACARHHCPVLLASTSEVYGKNTDLLAEDGDCVLGSTSLARWSYATSKMAAEHYAHALGARGLRFAITRFFNVYGPLLDRPGGGRVISKFLGAIQQREPLLLVDGGHALRSFCYIDDAVEALLRLCAALESGDPRVAGRVFNIGRAEPVSVRRLAEEMIRLSGHTAGVREVPGVELFGAGFEEIPRRVPDVELLAETLAFRARTELEQGLRRTLAHWGLLAERPRPASAPLVPMVRPWFDADRALLERYRGALESGRVTNGGPIVHELEAALARWLDVPEVVAVSTGSDGLLLAARALDVRGAALLPSFTYLASLSAAAHVGLSPVFVDIDPETWTLDPAGLVIELSSPHNVGLVMPVNVYGVPPPLEEIARLARDAGTAVLYDDAHGFGTERRGARACSIVDVEVISMHATKVLPAVEGGLVIARDPRLMLEIRRLRAHGLRPDPLDSTPGWNAKLDELRAATALHSLRGIDEAIARRRAYASRLRAFLTERCTPAFEVQRIPNGVTSNFQNLAVLVPAEAGAAPPLERWIDAFAREGVEVRRYFYPPLHRLRTFSPPRPPLAVTEAVSARLLCLPLHSRMEERDLARIEAAARAVASTLGSRGEGA